VSDDDSDKAVGMSPMREAAISAHETYQAFKAAGFSRGEALELVARIVIAGTQAVVEKGTTPDE
jgi:uncharacterized protein YoaH (UPF0181 family)